MTVDDRPGQPAGHAAADRLARWLAERPRQPRRWIGARRTPGSCCHWTRGVPRGAAGRRLGQRAGRPVVYNAANEECVAAFTAGKLPFLGIVDRGTDAADAPDWDEPGTVEDARRRGVGPARVEIIAASAAE